MYFNYLFSLGRLILNFVLQLLIAKSLLLQLGEINYGNYSYLISTTLFFNLVLSASNTAFLRLFFEGERVSSNRLLVTNFLIIQLFNTIFLVGLFIIIYGQFYDVKQSSASPMFYLLGFLISGLATPLIAYYNFKKLFLIVFSFDVIRNLFYLILVFTLKVSSIETAFKYFFIINTLLVLLFYLFLTWRHGFNLTAEYFLINWTTFRSICVKFYSMLFWIYIGGVFFIFKDAIGHTIIKNHGDLLLNSSFAICLLILGVPKTVVSSLSHVASTYIWDSNPRNKDSFQKENAFFKLSLGLFVILSVPVLFHSDFVLSFFGNSTNLDYEYWLLPVFFLFFSEVLLTVPSMIAMKYGLFKQTQILSLVWYSSTIFILMYFEHFFVEASTFFWVLAFINCFLFVFLVFFMKIKNVYWRFWRSFNVKFIKFFILFFVYLFFHVIYSFSLLILFFVLLLIALSILKDDLRSFNIMGNGWFKR